MTPISTSESHSLSRRAAVAGLGASSLALATSRLGVSAQEATPPMAGHPIVGTWLSLVPMAPGTPPVANPTLFSPDGGVVVMAPASRVGPQGVTIASGGVGRWESTGERACRFMTVQVLSNPAGAYLGTLTIEGNLVVSDDGMTVTDSSPESHGTIRDPLGKVISTINGARDKNPVKGTRMDVGSPGYPEGTPAASTPTS